MKHLIIGTIMTGITVLGAVAADQTVGTSTTFKGPVGLQLYSLRDSFKTDVEGTLDKVKKLGFQHVELAGLYGKTPAEFKAMLEARGLKAVAGHYPLDKYLKDPDAIAAEAKAMGLEYVGVAWVPHKAPFDEAQCRATAKAFNEAGANMAARGLKFYYHNHGYEFQPHGDGTLFDLLVAETDPKLVSFQLDILWAVHPGQDPVKLLEKYGSRWALVHLKDLKKGVKGDLSGGTDTKNDVTLGTGQVDFPAVLKAAQKAGVKWYFIEDESPTVEEQVPQSLKFLSQVSLDAGAPDMNFRELLEQVASGAVSAADAAARLDKAREENLGFARLDIDRHRRRGFPEVIYCAGKTVEQVVRIVGTFKQAGQNVLGTRATPEQAAAVRAAYPEVVHHESARCLTLDTNPRPVPAGRVAVVCAGTSDLPVAEEAALTAEWMGARVDRVNDVGVAGLHRLFPHLETLRQARAVVVVAGMEGALPSVVAGLIDRPVIAVPTSVGYGLNLGGATALLAMLNSCSPGITVVNVDNGFGGGAAAAMINRMVEQAAQEAKSAR